MRPRLPDRLLVAEMAEDLDRHVHRAAGRAEPRRPAPPEPQPPGLGATQHRVQKRQRRRAPQPHVGQARRRGDGDSGGVQLGVDVQPRDPRLRDLPDVAMQQREQPERRHEPALAAAAGG